MTTRDRLECVTPKMLVLLATLSTLGCLEHEEKIVISPEGHVKIVHEVKGKRSDFEDGVCSQPVLSPWTTQKEGLGTGEIELRTAAEFDDVAAVPMTFADPEDELAEAQVSWTTTIDVEEVGNVVRYHFKRVYRRLDWGSYEVMRRRAIRADIWEKLLGARREAAQAAPFGALRVSTGTSSRPSDAIDGSIEERRQIVAALIEYERLKTHVFAQRALERVPTIGSRADHALLEARRTIDAFFAERLPIERGLEIFRLPTGDVGDRLKEFETRVDGEILHAFRRTSLPQPAHSDALRRGLALARRAYAVAVDLENESFSVTIAMPGRIVAHDGQKSDASNVTWKFIGLDLRDHEMQLTAISEVSK